MLSELLSQIGWTQVFFAKHIGVDPHTVSRWVKDCPPLVVVLYLELLIKQMNLKHDN